MEAPRRSPAAAGDSSENPSPEAADSSSNGQKDESQWLATLSEPELDLLISLKTLVKTRAKTAGYPNPNYLICGCCGHSGIPSLFQNGLWPDSARVVLLESLKERLEETSINPTFVDRLALLSDPGADFTNNGSESSDSEVVKPKKDQSTPNSVNKKRVQMPDGFPEEVGQSHKKRKMSDQM